MRALLSVKECHTYTQANQDAANHPLLELVEAEMPPQLLANDSRRHGEQAVPAGAREGNNAAEDDKLPDHYITHQCHLPSTESHKWRLACRV